MSTKCTTSLYPTLFSVVNFTTKLGTCVIIYPSNSPAPLTIAIQHHEVYWLNAQRRAPEFQSKAINESS